MKNFINFVNESQEDFGNILHLTMKGQWFDMIASGEKKEEYRIIKPYWNTRLEGRQYDTVKFRQGYNSDSPTMWVECKGIQKGGKGNSKWGWDEECWIIKLGKILKIENYEQKN
jgi:hypothetical protein